MNIELIVQILEDFDYQLDSAENGRQALEKVSAEAPDLILLDVMMPQLDGFSVCQTLKNQEQTRFIPVVIMTALGDTEDRVKGIEAGADDFLTKPVNEQELLARVKTCLKQKAAMDKRFGRLQQVNTQLAKFVPDTVQRLLAENPGAPQLEKRERDVSVLFADICGYTKLSEELPVETLNARMARYFQQYLEVIRQHSGDINEVAGDGFMAIFMEGGKAHADRALAAARTLQQRTQELNTRESPSTPFELKVGVNSGSALVGSTEVPEAKNARLTFTATGSMTNLCARICGLARGGQILLGPETAQRLQGDPKIRDFGRHQLKNVSQLVHVFRGD